MRPILFALALLLAVLPASSAVAAEIPCDTESLRAAITAANEAGSDDEQVITLAEGCTYSLDAALPTLDGGLRLLIEGNGATIERSADSDTSFRILDAPRPALTIRDLTIAQGDVKGHGGGINADTRVVKQAKSARTAEQDAEESGSIVLERVVLKGNTATQQGGGLYVGNGVEATITDSVFDGNQANAGGGGIALAGASATISGTAFTANVAGSETRPLPCQSVDSGPSAIDGAGGALLGQDFDPKGLDPISATVTNSTFSGNVAACGAVATHVIDPDSLVTLVHTTVTASQTPNGALHNHGGPAVSPGNEQSTAGTQNGDPEIAAIAAQSTIVTGQAEGPNCNQEVVSLGHNLEDEDGDADETCGFTQDTDVRGADADLQELSTPENGTPEHPLGEDSAALDAAGAGPCAAGGVTVDQNGTDRPQRAGCDIGASEATPIPPTVSVGDDYTGTVGETIELGSDVEEGSGEIDEYEWTIEEDDSESAAAGSFVMAAAAGAAGCTLSDDSVPAPTITCSSAGTRVLSLTVTDVYGQQASDTATLTVSGSAVTPADDPEVEDAVETADTGGGAALAAMALLGLAVLARRRRD